MVILVEVRIKPKDVVTLIKFETKEYDLFDLVFSDEIENNFVVTLTVEQSKDLKRQLNNRDELRW